MVLAAIKDMVHEDTWSKYKHAYYLHVTNIISIT